ncbi:Transcription factor unc-86 [Rhizophlyctis rosea]|nr:Transcription factor unc-86 [Rhizophlyctis rosea]
MAGETAFSWRARALLLLATTWQLTSAAFLNLKITPDIVAGGWGSGPDIATIPSTLPPLPSGGSFLRVYHPVLSTWWGSGYNLNILNGKKFANATSSSYGTWNIYIYPVSGDVGQAQFQLAASGVGAVDTWLYQFTTGYTGVFPNATRDANTLPLNQWTKLTIDLNTVLAGNTQGAITGFNLMNPTGGAMDCYMAMWLGNPIMSLLHRPHLPTVNHLLSGPKAKPAFNKSTPLNIPFCQSIRVLTPANMEIWASPPNGTARRLFDVDVFPDLSDVLIAAYRDTTRGPLLMDISNAVYDSVESTVTYHHMYDKTIVRWAWDAPNPILGCLLHNADYFVIGDTKTANFTLQVWDNSIGGNLNFIIGGYAQWVKEKRVNGKDTVAVVLRFRLPNSMRSATAAGSDDYQDSMDLKVNCTTGAPAWQCPDHWWFNDMQLGVMKQQKDILRPLTNYSLSYFTKTGFDPAVDMTGSANTLVTLDGKQYALPVYVLGYPWRVRNQLFTGFMVETTSIPPVPFKAPPPLGDWGRAWWQNWNVTTFLDMLDYLYDVRNMTGIFTLPSDFKETAFYNYLGIGFGATIFDSSGHCGMNTKSEEVLNKTLMHWLSKPGLLSDRYIMNGQDIFYAWIKQPINWDHLQVDAALAWQWGHPSWAPGNSWVAQGFDTGYCYTGDCQNIYPPTGMSRIVAGLVGIPTTSNNADIAYEALMFAIVRNEAVQANVPQQYTQSGGVSPWVSAESLPEYTTANRQWWADLVAHGVFAGYPAQQTYGYFETQMYDPLKLVTAEIMYKNLSLSDAVTRACKEDICRVNLAVTQQPLPAVIGYLSSTTISSDSAIGKGIFALCVLGIIVELVLIGMFFVYRNVPVIRAASFVPSIMIMLGAILALISVMLRISIQNNAPSWAQCFGTYWFFSIGFSTLLGSLAMKTYRIYRIFSSASKGRSGVWSNVQLVGAIMLLNVGNVILMLVFQFWIADDSRVKATAMPNSDIVLYQDDCPASHDAAPVLLYVYNAFIVALAAFYAYRTRNVVSSFNENTFTVAAISLVSIVSIIIVPVLQIIDSTVASFILIALGTFLASVLSTLVFAIPKLLIAMGLVEGENIGTALQQNVKTGAGGSSMAGQKGAAVKTVAMNEGLHNSHHSSGAGDQSSSNMATFGTSGRLRTKDTV